ncbi:MAG: hypothetical protein FWD06_10305 [Oscillospiraceae bacterium]|nr:hypothetical protein [Oscillospiraceae bacterium]
MKKLIMFLTLSAAVIFFQSCSEISPVDETSHTEAPTVIATQAEQITVPHVAPFGGEYFGRDIEIWDFNQAFHNNSIDQAFYNDEQLPTGPIIGVYGFLDYWRAEVDAVFIKLLDVLNEEDAALLKMTQETWAEYMEHSELFRVRLLGSYDIGAGRSDGQLIGYVLMRETRARAIELMEFYFRLTGEIMFVFEG